MPLEPTRRVEDLRVWRGTMPVVNRYTAGLAGERFLRALRDEARLLGTRCSRCGVTYVPGRLFCERCFDELTEWVEVGPAGTVEAVTALHLAPDGSRLEVPVLLALIRLDGADTVLFHRLGGIETENARIGLRVRPVFKDAAQRTGSILDIVHFTPG
jgi:uncharacterized OB-fold protein